MAGSSYRRQPKLQPAGSVYEINCFDEFVLGLVEMVVTFFLFDSITDDLQFYFSAGDIAFGAGTICLGVLMSGHSQKYQWQFRVHPAQ